MTLPHLAGDLVCEPLLQLERVGELVGDAGGAGAGGSELGAVGEACRVAEMLGFPLAQVEQVAKRRQGDDGRTTTIEMNAVKPAKWSFQM